MPGDQCGVQKRLEAVTRRDIPVEQTPELLEAVSCVLDVWSINWLGISRQ